jgi:hypothetical protein
MKKNYEWQLIYKRSFVIFKNLFLYSQNRICECGCNKDGKLQHTCLKGKETKTS